MSKTKKRDNVPPFNPDNWVKWSSAKRLAWLTNFRDKMRGGDAEKFGFDEAKLKQMDAVILTYTNIVAMELVLRDASRTDEHQTKNLQQTSLTDQKPSKVREPEMTPKEPWLREHRLAVWGIALGLPFAVLSLVYTFLGYHREVPPSNIVVVTPVTAAAEPLLLDPEPPRATLGSNASCPEASDRPKFNPFQVSYEERGETCKDFPAIVIRRVSDRHYPINEQELFEGITAKCGDELLVRVYVDNGARDTLPSTKGTANNFRITSTIDQTSGEIESIIIPMALYVSIEADNAQPLRSFVPVHIPAGCRLEVVPGSGELWSWKGELLRKGINIGSRTIALSYLEAGFENSLFLRWRIKVLLRN